MRMGCGNSLPASAVARYADGQIMTWLFRFAFALVLILVTYLTTTEDVYPGTDVINDKLAHVIAFLVLAFLGDFSFPRSTFGWVKGLGLLGYGLAIEVIQHFIPARTFSLFDLAADATGLIGYACLVPVLRRIHALAPRSEDSAG